MISLFPETAVQTAAQPEPAPSGAAAVVPSTEAQLAALLNGAGAAPLDDIGWLRVTGSDRIRWLNGMVTNSIQDLKPGHGCYNFVLNAQGRIQADLTAFPLADSILLEADRDQIEKLIAHLDHFIIMDDVELADIGNERAGVVLAGPEAAALLDGIGIDPGIHSAPQMQTASWKTWAIETIRAYGPLVPRFELWGDPVAIAALAAALTEAGATPVSPEALEQLRILEGKPRYGTDIRNTETTRDLPQETGQTRALHFSKGCYLGQEIVERIRSRGNVHRTFSGFELHGALPAAGAILQSDGKPVGELTSVAAIPVPDNLRPPGAPRTLQFALGYIRREALDRGLPIEYPGGIARPAALPYGLA
jgi:folate-binding protein YgfZ